MASPATAGISTSSHSASPPEECGWWRPICPGRGRSAWLDHPEDYATPLYLSVMAGLVARLRVGQVDWVGTSLGGHLGMQLAARPGAPIRRLVLNDFGARIPAAGLQRIAAYLRVKRRFRSVDELEGHLRQIHAPFGPLTDSQWQHLARHSAQQAGDGQIEQHYDPAIARQFYWPLMLDIALWHVWDSVACPVMILRGEHSDLLLPGTMKEMKQRGIAAAKGMIETVEIEAADTRRR